MIFFFKSMAYLVTFFWMSILVTELLVGYAPAYLCIESLVLFRGRNLWATSVSSVVNSSVVECIEAILLPSKIGLGTCGLFPK